MASSVAVGSAIWRSVGSTRTWDRNGDGRPDIWESFDASGSLTCRAEDTNFDGRKDIEEWRQGGTLSRREVDRNFDGRVDLVESFDPDALERTRAVIDLNFDGAADALVLFSHGRPVLTRRLLAPVRLDSSVRRVATTDPAGTLVPLTDPFRSELGLLATPRTSSAAVPIVSLKIGLPNCAIELLALIAPTRGTPAFDDTSLVASRSSACAPRSPPLLIA